MSSLPLLPLQSGKIDKAGEEEQGAANNCGSASFVSLVLGC